MSQKVENPTHRLFGVSFGLLTSREVKELSVKEITNSQSFDALKNPTYGGLYDRAFGPCDQQDVCATCGQNNQFCPGHMGHISLPLPVYSPVLFRILLQLLKRTCLGCHHLLMQRSRLLLLSRQLQALGLGSLAACDELQMIHNDLRSEHESDAAGNQLLQQALDQCLKTYRDESVHISKHIVECRRLIVEELMNGNVMNMCPLCRQKARPISAEHNSRIFYSLGRKGQKKTTAPKKSKAKPKLSQDEADEEEDLEMDDGEAGKSQEENDKDEDIASTAGLQYMTPVKARDHLRKLWEKESDVLAAVFGALNIATVEGEAPTDVFFLDVLPVSPPRFRPVLRMKERFYDNPMSANFRKVVEDCINMRELLVLNKNKQLDEDTMTEIKGAPGSGSNIMEKLHSVWLQLQIHVNIVIDSDLDKIMQDKSPGIKQLLEKKEGLFRRNMMGKRVNYAARSVISPDPYISTNEVGVPQIFAKKLTYPESVTPWNYHVLKQAVINGPLVYPGAFAVINEDGSVTRLNPNNKTQREAVAKQLLTPGATIGSTTLSATKKVCRHLINGDVLLLNRQPTLHKPSMQAHRARVLAKEKTLRMHYSNCKAYNADFDGDEMNAHMPQSEAARSDAYMLASSDQQYLVPKDGTPLAGLIQDHMIGGVTLTMRGRFFDKATFVQLVYNALSWHRGKIHLPPPSIIKPQMLWSGKQVLSTIIINIIPAKKPPLNLEGRAKINDKTWITTPMRPSRARGILPQGVNMSETEVIIRQGQLLVGVLDKGHYGPTAYGLVHCCYELYGGAVAGQMLTSFARVFTSFLQLRGFTLGIEDLLCTELAENKRIDHIATAEAVGREAAADAFELSGDDAENPFVVRHAYQQAHFSADGMRMKELDLAMKKVTDNIQDQVGKICMPNGLQRKFPINNLQLMVLAGAKGTSVNCMQMSCMLGQIELEGRRPQLMMSGQSLPSFMPYDCTPRSGGFVAGRFLTGIRPQEYFFHCMAGREGLIDTAVKTSRSGYLQRCLIKHLEGIMVQYDMTTRDSDGSVIQFQYGEDGLDILKTKFLKTSQFPFLIHNREAVCKSREIRHLQRVIDFTSAPQLWEELDEWRQRHSYVTKGLRRSGFLHFCSKNFASFIDEHDWKKLNSSGRTEATAALVDTWRNLSDSKRRRYQSKYVSKPAPVASTLNACRSFGAITEALDSVLHSYITTNPDQLLTEEGSLPRHGRTMTSPEALREMIYLLSLKALAPPGEAVGLLAAQSLGEPSTQMTLNTFHFAGRGEMNVTLGIPRLREILLVASANIKTPTMEIPLTRDANARDKAKRLQESLNAVKLSTMVESVEIREVTRVKSRNDCNRQYTIRISFLSKSTSDASTTLRPKQLVSFVEKKFLISLVNVIRKRFAEMEKSTLLSAAKIRDRRTKDRSNDEEDGGGGGGAGNSGAAIDEDVSDDDQQEDDAAARKTVDRQRQERDYEGEEEEREEVVGEDAEDEDDEDGDARVTRAERLDDEDEGIEEDEADDDVTSLTRREKVEADKRIGDILKAIPEAVNYAFDGKKFRWCELTIEMPLSNKTLDVGHVVEAEIRRTEISQTKGISRCFLQEGKVACGGGDKALQLVTQGINIQEMHKYEDFLDLNRLYSNDVHGIASVYGIEAAYQIIMKEMRAVFAVYGIDVDYRHLSLVADYMTFEGRYKPFNRIAMQSNVSPLQQMTFETTMSFLKTATIQGAKDDLKSPSARIVVGRVVGTGTGAFDLLQPLV